MIRVERNFLNTHTWCLKSSNWTGLPVEPVYLFLGDGEDEDTQEGNTTMSVSPTRRGDASCRVVSELVRVLRTLHPPSWWIDAKNGPSDEHITWKRS